MRRRHHGRRSARARAARSQHGDRDGAQPVHRLRADRRDRQGGGRDRPPDPRARARARLARRKAARRHPVGGGDDPAGRCGRRRRASRAGKAGEASKAGGEQARQTTWSTDETRGATRCRSAASCASVMLACSRWPAGPPACLAHALAPAQHGRTLRPERPDARCRPHCGSSATGGCFRPWISGLLESARSRRVAEAGSDHGRARHRRRRRRRATSAPAAAGSRSGWPAASGRTAWSTPRTSSR